MATELLVIYILCALNLAMGVGTCYLMYRTYCVVEEIKKEIKSGFLTTILDTVKGILGGLLGGFLGPKKV